MGYTKADKEVIAPYLINGSSVLDFGSSNDYEFATDKPPFIKEWFNQQGIKYTSVDLAGDNGAIQKDCSELFDLGERFDGVFDLGFSEHVVQMNEYEKISFHDGHINSIYPKGEPANIELGYYNCWQNKHRHLKIGGIMISINPLTGNWPGHGYSYLGEAFYNELAKVSDLEIIEQGVNYAMGNMVDGANLFSVLRKTGNSFPSFEEFQKLPIFKK